MWVEIGKRDTWVCTLVVRYRLDPLNTIWPLRFCERVAGADRGADWRQIAGSRSKIDRHGICRQGKSSRSSLSHYLKLYTAVHQKLSRRIIDRREILMGNAVDFSGENVASEL
jgi:hypothetical protein